MYIDNVFVVSPSGMAPVPAMTIDPRVLAALAIELRQHVEAQPALQAQLANATISVAPFTLSHFADNHLGLYAAEDLATALVNENFHVVDAGAPFCITGSIRIATVLVLTPRS